MDLKLWPEIIVFACRLMKQVVTLAAIKRMLCVDSLGNRFVLTSLMHSVVQVAEARVSGNLTFVNLLLPDIKVCKSAFKHFLFTLEKHNHKSFLNCSQLYDNGKRNKK